MLVVECSIWRSLREDLKETPLQPCTDSTSPCCTQPLTKELDKHRHQGTSPKAGFGMTVSIKVPEVLPKSADQEA